MILFLLSKEPINCLISLCLVFLLLQGTEWGRLGFEETHAQLGNSGPVQQLINIFAVVFNILSALMLITDSQPN